MSFLKSLPITGGIGAAMHPTEAAQGLGHLLNISPAGIGMFGKAMNGIASAGGATPGYQGSTQPNNYMQNADPDSLQATLAKFGNTNMPVSVTNQMPPPRFAGMGIPEYAR
jgi:hypothetical protein